MLFFFRYFPGERRQAQSECEAPDKRDEEDAEKTSACLLTIVLLHSTPDIHLKGTVTRFCACGVLISGLATFFQDWLLAKKSSIDSETPEKSTVSVFKTYLIHFGSFKRHILYFCASIVEKIRSY